MLHPGSAERVGVAWITGCPTSVLPGRDARPSERIASVAPWPHGVGYRTIPAVRAPRSQFGISLRRRRYSSVSPILPMCSALKNPALSRMRPLRVSRRSSTGSRFCPTDCQTPEAPRPPRDGGLLPGYRAITHHFAKALATTRFPRPSPRRARGVHRTSNAAAERRASSRGPAILDARNG